MMFFTVHEPPNPPADRLDRAETLKFVRDGFVKRAFSMGPLWLVSKRLWRALAVYAVAVALVAGIVLGLGLSTSWIGLAIVGFHLILAFEGASLERLALEHDGWQTLGTVSGKSLDECERRFLEGWLASQAMPQTMASGSVPAGGLRLSGAADGASGGRLGGRRWGIMSWKRG